MMCLSAMIRLELPHVNVLTKMDLVEKEQRELLEDESQPYICPDIPTLVHDLNKTTSKKFHRLNEAIGSLIEDYSMVGFIPLDITSEDSIDYVANQIDFTIQYGEDLEPRAPDDLVFDPDDE